MSGHHDGAETAAGEILARLWDATWGRLLHWLNTR